jgi:hypothetical protein
VLAGQLQTLPQEPAKTATIQYFRLSLQQAAEAALTQPHQTREELVVLAAVVGVRVKMVVLALEPLIKAVTAEQLAEEPLEVLVEAVLVV